MSLLRLTALLVALTFATDVEAQVPLPFDTTGARRGTSSRQYEYGSGMRWLGGDTLLTTNVAVGQAGPDQSFIVGLLAKDTNASRLEVRPLTLAKCPVDLRLYRDARRTRVAWSSVTSRNPCPTPHPGMVEGGIDVSWKLREVLGDSLPPSRYFLTYVVRLADGRALEFTGDVQTLTRRAPGVHDWSTLTYTSGVGIQGQGPKQLHGWAVVRNSGTRPVHLAHGACVLRVRLWRDSARTVRVWRSEFRRPVEARRRKNVGYACPMPLYVRDLPPGDTLAFSEDIPLGEIFQDSVPDGRYWTSVDIELLDDSLPPQQWATHKEFGTGSITLRRSVDSMPSQRQVGAFRVEAAARVVHHPRGDSLKVVAMVTNTSRDSATLTLVRGNPLTAYVYKDDGTRDVADLADPSYVISGAAAFVRAPFDFGPGDKWVFENAAAVSDIAAKAGAGDYYVTVWLLGEQRMLLSAGVATLAR